MHRSAAGFEPARIADLLSRRGTEDDQRRVLDQRFGAREPARLADHDVGSLEQQVDMRRERHGAHAPRACRRQGLDLGLQDRVRATHHQHLRPARQRRQPLGEFGHGPHTGSAAHDQHQRTVEFEPEARAHRFAAGGAREARIDRDSRDLDALARHPVPGQLLGDLFARHEVAVDMRIRPRRMRGEVGDHDMQWHVEPAFSTDWVERFDGQEMRAHDGVRPLALDDAHQTAQRQSVECLARRTRALVDALLRPQRVQRAPQPWRTLRHGAVTLRVGAAIETRREHQRVDFAYLRIGRQRGQRMGDGDRGTLVPAAGRGVQDGDARTGTARESFDRDHATAGLGEQHFVIGRERTQPAAPPRALPPQPRTPLRRERRQAQPAETREPDHVSRSRRCDSARSWHPYP